MIECNLWSKNEEDDYIKNLNHKIEDAWDKAMNDPYPDTNVVLDYVYASKQNKKHD